MLDKSGDACHSDAVSLTPPVDAATLPAPDSRLGDVVLRGRGLTKSFVGHIVLADADLELRAGQVLGLVGENGAGKSTLMKVLAGVHHPDGGTIEVAGEDGRLRPPAPGPARRHRRPSSRSSTCSRSARSPRTSGSAASRAAAASVDTGRMQRDTQALLDGLGVTGIRPTQRVRTLSVAEQQIVEIAKAISFDARVIQMDEPTAALADHEVELLYGIIRGLTERGVAILYVSHRLKEVFDLCDTITVLKDGQQVTTKPASELDDAALVRLMVGRSISSFFPDQVDGTEVGEPRLELRGAGNGYVDGVDLTLRAGEIVGIAGLQGSGRTELLEAVFGVRPFSRGEMLVEGRSRSVGSPRQAVRAGLAMITEDRKATGLALHQTILDNALGVVRAVFPRRTAQARREMPGLLSSLGGRRPRDGPGGAVPLRRQPAEGRARPLAGHASPRGADGRAHPRHRRRRQARHLRADAHPGRRGRQRADGLQRAPRGDRHVRPDPGHARRPPGGRAARRRHRGAGARARDRRRRHRGRCRMKRLTSTGIVVGVLLLVIVVGAVLTAVEGRNFFSVGNIRSILTLMSVLGFIAIGQTLVILVGSLDLSVPYVASLTSVLAGGIMAGESGNVLPGVLAAVAVAALIGLVNGLVVSRLDVHGFVATLGTGLVISGYLATNYQGNHGSAPRSFRLIGATQIGPVPVSWLIMLGCALAAIWMLRRTRLGHHLYAVGGNPEVARMSGIRTWVPVVAAHVLCSVLAALAGLLLLARLSVGSPTIGTQGGYDLMSIAAVVLGGTLLAGGKGNVVGTIAGVAIFACIDNVMGVMQVNPFLRDVVRGVVIVAAVAVYARREIDRRPAPFERPTALDAALQEAR